MTTLLLLCSPLFGLWLYGAVMLTVARKAGVIPGLEYGGSPDSYRDPGAGPDGNNSDASAAALIPAPPPQKLAEPAPSTSGEVLSSSAQSGGLRIGHTPPVTQTQGTESQSRSQGTQTEGQRSSWPTFSAVEVSGSAEERAQPQVRVTQEAGGKSASADSTVISKPPKEETNCDKMAEQSERQAIDLMLRAADMPPEQRATSQAFALKLAEQGRTFRALAKNS